MISILSYLVTIRFCGPTLKSLPLLISSRALRKTISVILRLIVMFHEPFGVVADDNRVASLLRASRADIASVGGHCRDQNIFQCECDRLIADNGVLQRKRRKGKKEGYLQLDQLTIR